MTDEGKPGSSLESEPPISRDRSQRLGALVGANVEVVPATDPALVVAISRHLSDYDHSIRQRLLDRSDIVAGLQTDDGRLLSVAELKSRLQNLADDEVCRQFISQNPGTTVAAVDAVVAQDKTKTRAIIARVGCYLLGGRLYLADQLSPDWRAAYCLDQTDRYLADQSSETRRRVLARPGLFNEITNDESGLRTDWRAGGALAKISQNMAISDHICENPDGVLLSDLRAATDLSLNQVYDRCHESGHQIIYSLVYSHDSQVSPAVVIGQLISLYLDDFSTSIRDRVAANPDLPDRLFDDDCQPRLSLMTAKKTLLLLARSEFLSDLLLEKPGQSIADLAEAADLSVSAIYKYVDRFGWHLHDGYVYLKPEMVVTDEAILRARISDMIDLYMADYDLEIRDMVRRRDDLEDRLIDADGKIKSGNVAVNIITRLGRIELIRRLINQQPGISDGALAAELDLKPTTVRRYLQDLDHYLIEGRVYSVEAASQPENEVWLRQLIEKHLVDYDREVREQVAAIPDLFAICVAHRANCGARRNVALFFERLANLEVLKNYMKEHRVATIFELMELLGVSRNSIYRYGAELGYRLDAGLFIAATETDAPIDLAELVRVHLSDYQPSIQGRVAASEKLIKARAAILADPETNSLDQLNFRRLMQTLADREVFIDYVKQQPDLPFTEMIRLAGISRQAGRDCLVDLDYYILGDQVMPATVLTDSTDYNQDLIERHWADCDDDLKSRLIQQPDLVAAVFRTVDSHFIDQSRLQNRLRRLGQQTVLAAEIQASPGLTVAQLAAKTGISNHMIRVNADERGWQVSPVGVYMAGQMESAELDSRLRAVVDEVLADYDPGIRDRVLGSDKLRQLIKEPGRSTLVFRNQLLKLAKQTIFADYMKAHQGPTVAEVAEATGIGQAAIYNYISDMGYISLAGRVCLLSESSGDGLPGRIRAIIDSHLSGYDESIRQRVRSSPDLDDLLPENDAATITDGLLATLTSLARRELTRDIIAAQPGIPLADIGQRIGVNQSTVRSYMRDVGAIFISGCAYGRDADLSSESVVEHLVDHCLADFSAEVRDRVKQIGDISDRLGLDIDDLQSDWGRSRRRLVSLAKIEQFKDIVATDPGRDIKDYAALLDLAPTTVIDYATDLDDCRLIGGRIYKVATPETPAAALADIRRILADSLRDCPDQIRQRVLERSDLLSHFLDQSGQLFPQGRNNNVQRTIGRLVQIETTRGVVKNQMPIALADLADQLQVVPSTARQYIEDLNYAIVANFAFDVTPSVPLTIAEVDHICDYLCQVWLPDQTDQIRQRVARSEGLRSRLLKDNRILDQGQRLSAKVANYIAKLEMIGDYVTQNQGAPIGSVAAAVGMTPGSLGKSLAEVDCSVRNGRVYTKAALQSGPSAKQKSAGIRLLVDRYIKDQPDIKQAIMDQPEIVSTLIDDNGWPLVPGGSAKKHIDNLVRRFKTEEYVRRNRQTTVKAIGDHLKLSSETVRALVRDNRFVIIGNHVLDRDMDDQSINQTSLLEMAARIFLDDKSPAFRQRVIESEHLRQICGGTDGAGLRHDIGNLLLAESRRLSVYDYVRQNPGLTVAALSERLAVSMSVLRADINQLARQHPDILKRLKMRPSPQPRQSPLGEFIETRLSSFPDSIRQKVGQRPDLRSELGLESDYIRRDASPNRLYRLAYVEWIKEIIGAQPGVAIESIATRIGRSVGFVGKRLVDMDFINFAGAIFSPDQLERLSNQELANLMVDLTLKNHDADIKARVAASSDIAAFIEDRRQGSISLRTVAGLTKTVANRLILGDYTHQNPGLEIKAAMDILDAPRGAVLACARSGGMLIRGGRIYHRSQYQGPVAKKRPRNRSESIRSDRDQKKKPPSSRSSPRPARTSSPRPLAAVKSASETPQPDSERVKIAQEIKRQHIDLGRSLSKAISASGINRETYISWFLTDREFAQVLLPFLPFPKPAQEYTESTSGSADDQNRIGLRSVGYRNYVKRTNLSERRQHRQQLQDAIGRNPGLVEALAGWETTDHLFDLVADFGWDDDWPFIIFTTLDDHHLNK